MVLGFATQARSMEGHMYRQDAKTPRFLNIHLVTRSPAVSYTHLGYLSVSVTVIGQPAWVNKSYSRNQGPAAPDPKSIISWHVV